MKKIKARLLNRFSMKVCSITGCRRQAAIQHGPHHYMCQHHVLLVSAGRLALEKEQERKRKLREDFLQHVEPHETLMDIEKAGFENYDPETDQPKDKGRFMHQKRGRKNVS